MKKLLLVASVLLAGQAFGMVAEFKNRKTQCAILKNGKK